MSLLEITIAIALLVTGLLSFMQAMMMLERSHARAREVGRATQAARRVIEAIQAEAFAEAFRRYNGDAADDPGGAGSAPGKNFAVPGLSARANDPDGFPGEVIFPSPPGQPSVLRENVVDSQLGMPRDLDGDGLVSAVTDCATTYRLLPVRVRVEWVGPSGPGSVSMRTMIGNF